MKVLEYVLSDHGVNSLFTILSFPVEISAHGVSFPASGLAVSETSSHSSLENRLNEGFGRESKITLILKNKNKKFFFG